MGAKHQCPEEAPAEKPTSCLCLPPMWAKDLRPPRAGALRGGPGQGGSWCLQASAAQMTTSWGHFSCGLAEQVVTGEPLLCIPATSRVAVELTPAGRFHGLRINALSWSVKTLTGIISQTLRARTPGLGEERQRAASSGLRREGRRNPACSLGEACIPSTPSLLAL